MTTGLRYSLVVMTFNRPAPLLRCLESLENLDWDGDRPEVIVVDDGSQPPVQLEAKDFPTFRLRTVRLEHKGVSAARNAGIAASSGDCVAFIADDYVLPRSYLKDIDRFFVEHADAQVISHNVAPSGALLFRPVQQLYFELAIGQEIPAGQARRDLIHSFTLPASRAAMFRKKVFEEIGGFNDSLRTGEDGEFGRRLARAGIPVYLFRNKRIFHFEARESLDYFRQRLRYGRSYIRSGVSGLAIESVSRPAFLSRMVKMLGKKLRFWWQVSGRLGCRLRFTLLSPFLVMFLSCFYYGAYREFSRMKKEAEGERART